MEFTRLTCKYVSIDLSGTKLANGDPATVTSVKAALTVRAGTTDADTEWVDAELDGPTQIAKVLVAGPDADPGGTLTLGEEGGRLWFMDVDSPETDLFSACVIRLVWAA
jgi:hypothetical protein